VTAADLPWLPVAMLIQLTLTMGLALIVSALTVHFRDLRDVLGNLVTLWFWATPLVYHISQVPESFRPLLDLNPFTHLAVSYQEILFAEGVFQDWPRLLLLGLASAGVLVAGYAVFDRLRDTLAEEV
jgi:ABC-type polysaccharide/polyol phosphate export permease